VQTYKLDIDFNHKDSKNALRSQGIENLNLELVPFAKILAFLAVKNRTIVKWSSHWKFDSILPM